VLGIVSATKHERVIAQTDRKSVQQTAQNRTAVELITTETAAEPTYVGREACKECHAENYRLHGQHGHAHTFASADDTEIADKFVGKSFDAGLTYGTYTYHADDEGLFARLPDRFGDEPFRLPYALGSGHNAITLLTLIPDPVEETVGIEHRATWYSSKDELGPTPGQEETMPNTLGELFGHRHVGRVMHKCVYCHTTTGKIAGGEIIDLTPNVNCEKCHGPASEHVRQARSMRNPPPFAVGREDWDTESEIQLCGDCHRLPDTMSRKELREYPNHLTRFQPIGLLRSKCYLESDHTLKCTTCHNPHTTIKATPKADHVKNCVSCHLIDSPSHVACPVSPQEGCIECHMPQREIEHDIKFHDHWIRVHDDP
jgi:hypothetical protein